MERPIIFNDAMVRAILSGAKTETRRPLKKQIDVMAVPMPNLPRLADCPFGVPGDTLWVRECWRPEHLDTSVEYRADKGAKWFDASMMRTGDYDDAVRWSKKLAGGLWAPSIHMPRWAARTVLDVLEVRVERLQDMSEEDARAEGFDGLAEFILTWESIYLATASWASNPWVWVVRFKRQGGA
jgi:hypothetical protein